MTKLMQKNLFLLHFVFLVNVQNLPNCILNFKLKEAHWKKCQKIVLFSSSRQKNGIRSINLRYTLLPSLGVQLSGEVPFVISEWLVWELPPDNQRVSNWLFERSPIIIVVGFQFLFELLCFFLEFWVFSLYLIITANQSHCYKHSTRVLHVLNEWLGELFSIFLNN